MTGVTTGQRAFVTAVGSDDVRDFSVNSLTADLQEVDDLFHNSTGHNHDASGEGAPIGIAGLAAAVGNFGASTSWTPALQQSVVVTLSSVSGRYITIGSLVVAWGRCVASSAGTAGVAIAMTGLPVNEAGFTNAFCFGTFSRAANPNYLLVGQALSSSSVNFYSGNAATGLFGINPAITLASGDIVDVTFIYPVS
jgi:hypothetical protein